MRQELLIAAGRVSRPESHKEKRLVKALRRARRSRDACPGPQDARRNRDPRGPGSAGLRAARAACRRTARSRRPGAQDAEELLRLQGGVHAAASFLRRPLPRVRRAELREALPDGFARRSRRAGHGRAREDRLPDRAQDAPRGGPRDRHHAFPPRCGPALLAGARLRRMEGSPPRPRPRSAALPERRGLRALPGALASIDWTSSSTTPARPCGGRRTSTPTSWKTNRDPFPAFPRRVAACWGATRA